MADDGEIAEVRDDFFDFDGSASSSSSSTTPRMTSPSLDDISRPSSHETRGFRQTRCASNISASLDFDAVVKKIRGEGPSLNGGLVKLPSEFYFDDLELEEIFDNDDDDNNNNNNGEENATTRTTSTTESSASGFDEAANLERILSEIREHDRVVEALLRGDAVDEGSAAIKDESQNGRAMQGEEGKERARIEVRRELEERTGVRRVPVEAEDEDEDDLLNHWHRLQRVREDELRRTEKPDDAAASDPDATAASPSSTTTGAGDGTRHSLRPEGGFLEGEFLDGVSVEHDAEVVDTPEEDENLTDEQKVVRRRTAGVGSSAASSDASDLSHVDDPELRTAILKVRKLDRVLARKIRKERRVKRERLELVKKLRLELEKIEPKGKEEKENKLQFLALTLPESHSRDIEDDSCGLLSPFTFTNAEDDDADVPNPIFETQIPEFFSPQSREICRSRLESLSKTSGRRAKPGGGIKAGEKKGGRKAAEAAVKNFLRRNKELAGEAGEVVPFTEEEKKRLLELLEDVEMELRLETIEEEDEASAAQDSESSKGVTVTSGEGFLPSVADRQTLDDIERSLKNLAPLGLEIGQDQGEGLKPSSESGCASTNIESNSNRAHPKEASDVVDAKYGEKALTEAREARMTEAKLKDIDERLEKIRRAGFVEEERGWANCSWRDDIVDEGGTSRSPRLAEHVVRVLVNEAAASLGVVPPRNNGEDRQEAIEISEATLDWNGGGEDDEKTARKTLTNADDVSSKDEEIERTRSASSPSSSSSTPSELDRRLFPSPRLISPALLRQLLQNPRATSSFSFFPEEGAASETLGAPEPVIASPVLCRDVDSRERVEA